MRLHQLSDRRRARRSGVVADDRWLAAPPSWCPAGPRTMAELLAGGTRTPRCAATRRGRDRDDRRARRAARRRSSCSPRSRAPARSSAIGRNYREHVDEEGVEPPAAPLVFAKWPSSVIGDRAEIRWDPALTGQVDYEAELAVVIGRRARRGRRGGRPRLRPRLHVPERRLGARHPVRRRPVGPRQVARHVLPDGSGPRHRRRDRRPAGPRDQLHASATSVVQEARTSQMYFGVAEIISYCSRSFTLEPGDVIATGTPARRRRLPQPAALPRRRRRRRPSRSSGSGGSRTSAGSTPAGGRRHERAARLRRAVPRHRRARLHRRLDGPRARARGRAGRRPSTSAATARRLAPDHDPRGARRGHVRRRRHHRPRLRSSGRSTSTASRTSSTSPRSRCRSAGPIRRSARSSTSSARSTCSRRSSARPDRDGAARLHELDRDVLAGRRCEPGDRPAARGGGRRPSRATTTASTSWRTRAPPGSTGPTTGVSSIGLRPMTVYGAGRDQGMTSSPTMAIAAAVLACRTRSRSAAATLFQYAEDVARTLIPPAGAELDGAHVFNLGGSPVAMADWIAAIEGDVPEAPRPDHRRRRRRAAVPVGHRARRAGGARRRAGDAVPRRRSPRPPRSTAASPADGRLVGTEQGVPAARAGDQHRLARTPSTVAPSWPISSGPGRRGRRSLHDERSRHSMLRGDDLVPETSRGRSRARLLDALLGVVPGQPADGIFQIALPLLAVSVTKRAGPRRRRRGRVAAAVARVRPDRRRPRRPLRPAPDDGPRRRRAGR